MQNTVMSIILIIILVVVIYWSWRKTQNPESNQARESDARRFARLLIIEIKLYESYKLESGLKNNNLYESLQNEIEAARKKYKKRLPSTEFDKFFEEQLIDVLADGDSSKLGINYISLNK